jgi:hypothetical protein
MAREHDKKQTAAATVAAVSSGSAPETTSAAQPAGDERLAVEPEVESKPNGEDAKPWEKAGISRTTWFRQKRDAKAAAVDGGAEEFETEPAGNRHQRRAEAAKARKGKKPEEPARPLPEEPEPAAETPQGKRTKKDYPPREDDIFADEDDDEDDDFSSEAPDTPRLVEKPPKARYIRFRPGKENRATLYTIKLDEEDRRPNEMESYILTKDMREYFEESLDYNVIKQIVIDAVTLQGDFFMFMFPASSELSGNSWIRSRNDLLRDGMEGWIKVRSDMKARKYRTKKRSANLPEVKFTWPEEAIRSRALKAVAGPKLISSTDHPIARRLAGEADVDEE